MRKIKFKDIANFESGQSPESKYYTQSDGVPFLQGNRTFGKKYPNIDTYTTKVTKIAHKGEVLMSVRAPVGDLNIAPMDLCIGRGLGSIQSKKGNNEFIYYALKHNIKSLIKQGTGTTYLSVNKNIINDLDLIIPSEEDIQNKIASLLSNIDSKIENNYKIYFEFESMVKTIFNYFFLQYEFPNEEGKPYKSSGGEMLWNEDLNREIPKGWKVKEIGEVINSNRGISYNSKNLEGDGVPMINLASFGIDGTYKEDGIKSYNGNYTTDKVLKPFDLVICNTQQTAIDFDKDIIGRAFLVPDIFDGDVVHSHHVTKINVKNDDFKFYLSRLFNTSFFHKYIAGFTNGTNILGLDFKGIETYKTEIPDDKIMKKFAELSIDIEKRKSQIIKENKELASLRDFLLPLLMNGQVTFKD